MFHEKWGCNLFVIFWMRFGKKTWILLFHFYQFAYFINQTSMICSMPVLQWIFTQSYSWPQWIKHNCACPKFFLATPICLRAPAFSFSPFASDPTHIPCTVSLMRGVLYQNILEVSSEWASYRMWALGSGVLIKCAFLRWNGRKNNRNITDEIWNACIAKV